MLGQPARLSDDELPLLNPRPPPPPLRYLLQMQAVLLSRAVADDPAICNIPHLDPATVLVQDESRTADGGPGLASSLLMRRSGLGERQAIHEIYRLPSGSARKASLFSCGVRGRGAADETACAYLGVTHLLQLSTGALRRTRRGGGG